MDIAVGAGADDYEPAGDEWLLTTPPESLNVVLEALEKAEIAVKSTASRLSRRSKAAQRAGRGGRP